MYYYLQNPAIQKFVVDNSQRTAGQSGVNLEYLYTYRVLLPNKIEQAKLVEELHYKMGILYGIKKIKHEAISCISEILVSVWGVESVRTVNEGVTDEQES